MSRGKIVILGATGFVGSNVFEYLLNKGYEVNSLVRDKNNWRLNEEMQSYSIETVEHELEKNLSLVNPDIVLNLVADGGYSFQDNLESIVKANFLFVDRLANWCMTRNAALIHFGSSSEYGLNCAGPLETEKEVPNSHYAITKLAATHLLAHHQAKSKLRSVVLRLYSAYGPKEEPTRLMPSLIKGSLTGEWPEFTNLSISRDFIYIDDISRLVEKIIFQIHSIEDFEIFNVGTGRGTTLRDLAELCQTQFNMSKLKLGYAPRSWDLSDWYANIEKTSSYFNWKPEYTVLHGMKTMRGWYASDNRIKFLNSEYSLARQYDK